MNLSTSIEKIYRIGPQYQKKLKRMGIETIGQLIFHFPNRYEDFSEITLVSNAEIGKTSCFQGEITYIKNIKTWKKKLYLTELKIKDNSGEARAVWFNQPYLINTLKKGDFVFLAGKMILKNSKKYLSSPSYEKIIDKNNLNSTHTGRIIPIYPETEGVSSRWLRFIIKPLLEKIKDQILEPLPENEVLKKNNLLGIKEALQQIHFPESMAKAEKAKQRFIFEELFNLSLIVFSEKIAQANEKSAVIPTNIELIKKFVKKLNFDLTLDQKKAAWQIIKDMEKPRPMNRLLNGDVGSGKTIVALIAILSAFDSNFQSAFMAPTEILAKQHFTVIKKLFSKNKIKIGLITGKESFLGDEKIKRKEMLEKIKNNQCQIIVGTHSLIQEKVEFKNLGLIVIDEQHRFGIEQRAKLCRKQNFIPHFLSMSATPIPRTLALTVYGDLDLSLIKEMPKGRKKIITKIIEPENRQKSYQFIKKEIKKNSQVFVVCPRIEPSLKKDNDNQDIFFKKQSSSWQDVKAVKEEYEKLSSKIFPDLKIDMLHGKMKAEEKEKVLKKFKDKKTDILVSTSVIEVGIDFPNATIMMIEGSDKFGLAQLHQFRGRVGRGEKQSYCLLFSEFTNNPRLKAMVKSQDGFELAEKDLILRGPGDLTGQRQWGIPDFVMASLKNTNLVEKTRNSAKEILEKDPSLEKYPLLKKKIKEFQKRIHLE